MCGIVGYIGNSIEIKEIVRVLKKLEYRGYDSAGVSADLENGENVVIKETGNISKLEKIIPNKNCKIAIAHTRWATHGKPTSENAHPHSSALGMWQIVHNGIIENYLELKKELKFQPTSQTDTAVVAEVLEEKNAQTVCDFIDVMNSLDGSFAIVAKNKNYESLFLARRRSPLYVAKNKDRFFIASDPSCFAGFAKEYYELKNNEFAEVNFESIVFYDKDKNIVSKKTEKSSDNFEDSNKENFSHYMLKEIMEQNKALKRQVSVFKTSQVLEKFDLSFIKKFKEIKFVGCGTAYNAGLIGARYFEMLTGIKSQAEIASEFVYKKPIFAGSETLFIFISQSGETADTLRANEIAKDSGSITIAITNVLHSSLARNVDYVIPVCAGQEIAVASTKAYTCQLSALYMFASKIAAELGIKKVDYYDEILRVADQILNFDFEEIETIANEIKNKESVIFIGKDLDYVTAGEASLKLKEVGYINSSHYCSGELKHGYLALVENGTPIIVIASQKEINSKTFNSSSEAVSRGAKEYIFTNEKLKSSENRKVIVFNESNEFLLPILTIAPLQYLAYKVSVLKNINPDQPRNLAKSVTVEWWV